MVVLKVKQADKCLFLYETSVNTEIGSLLVDLIAIYNGRLKVESLYYEIQELSKYGICFPPHMQGLNPQQISELHLKDEWAEKNLDAKNYINCPDPMGRRNGLAPTSKYAEILTKTAEEAKAKIAERLVDSNVCLTLADIKEAVDILKGATMIAYPMGMPVYETVKQQLEDKGLSMQVTKEMLEETTTELWWAGKHLEVSKPLHTYVGKNEKSKLVVKLQKKGHGAPANEPALTEEQRKEYMLKLHRRQEEIKQLEEVDDDSYMNSQWADNEKLKRSFLGINKIRFK